MRTAVLLDLGTAKGPDKKIKEWLDLDAAILHLSQHITREGDVVASQAGCGCRCGCEEPPAEAAGASNCE